MRDINLGGLPQSLQELNANQRTPEPICALPPIDLENIDLSVVTGLRRIRAISTHTLLAYMAEQGIVFYDRRGGSQHLLSVAQIREALLAEKG